MPTFALLGGLATYLLALVAFRLRHVHTLNRQRLLVALLLFALIPLAVEISPLLILSLLVALLSVMIVYETISYGEARNRVRRELRSEARPS